MKKAAGIALAVVVLLLAHSVPGEARHFRGNVWIGPIWGPGWWGPPAMSYTYPYPYSYPYAYSAPPIVIRQEPQQYIQQSAPEPQQQYWYYCPDPEGYYPYVQRCPKGWMKVVPTPGPPETEEARPETEEAR